MEGIELRACRGEVLEGDPVVTDGRVRGALTVRRGTENEPPFAIALTSSHHLEVAEGIHIVAIRRTQKEQ